MTAAQLYEDRVQLPDDRPLMARDDEARGDMMNWLGGLEGTVPKTRRTIFEYILYLEEQNSRLEQHLSPEVDGE
ncbi:hypothetical protein LCGC14_0412080 [marine sediment metagenome]|uniref:Uncharacterized protein n=1 Tax=marine sediment metagenome TaxID=412755 RepID=A0A0F9TBC1_9ZZZZ